jgi:hypothetical protein
MMFINLQLSLLSLSRLLHMFLLLLVFLNTPRGDSVHVRIPKVSALDMEALGGLAETVRVLLESVRVLFEAVRVCKGSEW